MNLPSDDDIKRNAMLAEAGEAFDMPLKVLNGRLKARSYQRSVEYLKAYRQSAKYKAYVKAYRQSAKYKAYLQSAKYKAYVKAYRQSAKYKAYLQRSEVKAYQKAYQQSDKFKAYKKAYYQNRRELK